MAPNATCPNDETLTDFIEGRLTEDRRSQVEAHLVVCPVCREIAMVSAELVFGDSPVDSVPVPEAVTRRAMARAAGAGKKPLPAQILEQSRQWVAKGWAVIESFTFGPMPAPATLRGDAAGPTGAVVRREKQFGDLGFAIELEPAGDDGAIIQVAWAGPRPEGKNVRVALMAQARELASAVLSERPVLFEEIAFGTYTLVFVMSGVPLGEYTFEIKPPVA